MIIDAWMQHPTLRMVGSPIFASLRRWVGEELPTEEIPIDLTIAAMDVAGVSKATLSAWSSPRYGEMISNAEVAGWVAAHPDRFVGLASADLDTPMESVRELRRRVKDDGFKGLRMLPWLWDAAPTDRRYYPLYAGAVARKHANVYIDTSAWTLARLPQELVAYMKTGSGRHKVLFGSNFPMVTPQAALAGLDALELDDETRDLFLSANAQRVFDLS